MNRFTSLVSLSAALAVGVTPALAGESAKNGDQEAAISGSALVGTTVSISGDQSSADLDGLNGVTVEDWFYFIDVYFKALASDDPADQAMADADGSGKVNSDDLFYFLFMVWQPEFSQAQLTGSLN